MKKEEKPTLSNGLREKIRAWLDSDRDFNNGVGLFCEVINLIGKNNESLYRLYKTFNVGGSTKHNQTALAYELEKMIKLS
ncbi:MAG: hypothetical protein WCI71_02130 [Bacteroidota bacterium]